MSDLLYMCYLPGSGRTPRHVATSHAEAVEWLVTQEVVFGHKSRVVPVRPEPESKAAVAVRAESQPKVAVFRQFAKLYNRTWHSFPILRSAIQSMLEQRNWKQAKVIAHVEFDALSLEASLHLRRLVKPVLNYHGFHMGEGARFLFLRSEADLVAVKLAGLNVIRFKVLA